MLGPSRALILCTQASFDGPFFFAWTSPSYGKLRSLFFPSFTFETASSYFLAASSSDSKVPRCDRFFFFVYHALLLFTREVLTWPWIRVNIFGPKPHEKNEKMAPGFLRCASFTYM